MKNLFNPQQMTISVRMVALPYGTAENPIRVQTQGMRAPSSCQESPSEGAPDRTKTHNHLAGNELDICGQRIDRQWLNVTANEGTELLA
jgi:hypothetical protein